MNASSKMCFTLPNCALERTDFWDTLLKDIDDRKVVPIVGKDLLKIEVAAGRSIPLERFLAEKLAEECGKSLGAAQDMRHAIALYTESSKQNFDLYHLKTLIRVVITLVMLADTYRYVTH
jgi:hypothetical protein